MASPILPQPIPVGLCQCGCGRETSFYHKTDPRRGAVKGQPQRFVSGHYCREKRSQKQNDLSRPETFWRYVDKTDGCWLWMGSRDKDGYGLFCADYQRTPAHRVAWELINGAIPNGMFVCHNCPGGDNPSCVRPDHLFLGTNTDNLRDMAKKGRHWAQRYIQEGGKWPPPVKLNAVIVGELRERYAAGGVTIAALAQEYDIGQSTASQVISGKTWKSGSGPITEGKRR